MPYAAIIDEINKVMAKYAYFIVFIKTPTHAHLLHVDPVHERQRKQHSAINKNTHWLHSGKCIQFTWRSNNNNNNDDYVEWNISYTRMVHPPTWQCQSATIGQPGKSQEVSRINRLFLLPFGIAQGRSIFIALLHEVVQVPRTRSESVLCPMVWKSEIGCGNECAELIGWFKGRCDKDSNPQFSKYDDERKLCR